MMERDRCELFLYKGNGRHVSWVRALKHTSWRQRFLILSNYGQQRPLDDTEKRGNREKSKCLTFRVRLGCVKVLVSGVRCGRLEFLFEKFSS